mgnify:CR=1 FL=1
MRTSQFSPSFRAMVLLAVPLLATMPSPVRAAPVPAMAVSAAPAATATASAAGLRREVPRDRFKQLRERALGGLDALKTGTRLGRLEAQRNRVAGPSPALGGRVTAGDVVSAALKTGEGGVGGGISIAPFALAALRSPRVPVALTGINLLVGSDSDQKAKLGLAYAYAFISGDPLPSLADLGFECSYDAAQRTRFEATLINLEAPFVRVCQGLAASLPRPTDPPPGTPTTDSAKVTAAQRWWDAAELFCGLIDPPTASGMEERHSISLGAKALDESMTWYASSLNAEALAAFQAKQAERAADLKALRDFEMPLPLSCSDPETLEKRVKVAYQKQVWDRHRVTLGPSVTGVLFPGKLAEATDEDSSPVKLEEVKAGLEGAYNRARFDVSLTLGGGEKRESAEGSLERTATGKLETNYALWSLNGKPIVLDDEGNLPPHMSLGLGSDVTLNEGGEASSGFGLNELSFDVHASFLLSEKTRFRITLPVKGTRIDLPDGTNAPSGRLLWTFPVSLLYVVAL